MIRRLYVDEPEHKKIAFTLNNLGVLYLHMRRFEEAEPLLVEALSMYRRPYLDQPNHPSLAASIHNLATVYVDLKRYTDSQSLLEEALVMDRQNYKEEPDHPHVVAGLCNLAIVYRKLSRYTDAELLKVEALVASRRFYADYPRHPDVARQLYNLAVTWVGPPFHRAADAEPLYEEALAICREVLPPGHPLTLKAERHLTTCHQDMRRPGAPPRSTARQWVLRGQAAVACGDLPTAITAFTRAMVGFPTSPVLYLRRSLVWLDMQRASAAVQDLETAERLCPRERRAALKQRFKEASQPALKAWRRLGNTSFKASNFEEAVRLFSQVLALCPEDGALHAMHSGALLKAGRAEEALSAGKSAVRASSLSWEGHSCCGAALHALNRYREAVTAFEAGLSCDASPTVFLHQCLVRSCVSVVRVSSRAGEGEGEGEESVPLEALRVLTMLAKASGE